jgi:hypothetical protein
VQVCCFVSYALGYAKIMTGPNAMLRSAVCRVMVTVEFAERRHGHEAPDSITSTN